MAKERLDVLLVKRGYAPSREQARRTIMAGLVRVGGERADKPGVRVPVDAPIEVEGPLHPYVSRGGLKLEEALRVFSIDLTGRVVIDIGASTGGFTDCALQKGARIVYAVDVGYGQLAWKLRQDPRVVVMERTNFRAFSAGGFERRAAGRGNRRCFLYFPRPYIAAPRPPSLPARGGGRPGQAPI